MTGAKDASAGAATKLQLHTTAAQQLRPQDSKRESPIASAPLISENTPRLSILKSTIRVRGSSTCSTAERQANGRRGSGTCNHSNSRLRPHTAQLQQAVHVAGRAAQLLGQQSYPCYPSIDCPSPVARSARSLLRVLAARAALLLCAALTWLTTAEPAEPA